MALGLQIEAINTGMSKKKNKVWIFVVVIVTIFALVGIVGSKAFTTLQAQQKKAKEDLEKNTATVKKGDVVVQVVETGSLEAVKDVEVKSRVGGRVATLYVDEGDFVEEGDLIAIIDPQETELRVEQNRAQLRGAQSGVKQTDIQIAQRRVTAQANLDRAESRIRQLNKELESQPILTAAAVRSAEASLLTTQKNYDTLTRVTQPNQKIALETALQDAKNNLAKAKSEEARQKDLYDKGYVAKKVWEQAELQRQLAETRVTSSQQNLDRLADDQRLERERAQAAINQANQELNRAKANTIQDDLKKEEYKQAQANVRDARIALRDVDSLIQSRIGSQSTVEQLQSALKDAERELGETEIRAPISGIVSKRFVQQGELVASLSSFSSGTPIVKIEDRSNMLVKLNINEIDVARLEQGMPADITVDALPNETFTGRVSKIAPSMVDSTQGGGFDTVVKYEVEVTLNSVSKKLKSGMSAKCQMKAKERLGVLTLPVAYVSNDPEKEEHFVMLKGDGKDPKGTRKVVSVGDATSSTMEIKSGLKEGDMVVMPEYTGPPRVGMMQAGPDEESEE